MMRSDRVSRQFKRSERQAHRRPRAHSNMTPDTPQDKIPAVTRLEQHYRRLSVMNYHENTKKSPG